MKKWIALIVLGATQFLMVLDTSVMNVAISQLVLDFETDVAQIQAAITFYALVMAALMIMGGKLGDVWGRRRTFGIGMAIYAAGSALTAISGSVPVLFLGWSVLEGIGAALVLPAMMALVASNYVGRDRATAFGVIGGLAGVGVAVGPILGGWVTTNLTWRIVFVGEVVIAIAILLSLRWVADSIRPGKAPKIDWVGAVLSALGLGLVVYGALKSSQWGLIAPRNSPIEPFGFALTPFVVGAGFLLLYGFVGWQRRLEAQGKEPLIHLDLFRSPSLGSGLTMTLAQNVILAGVFFALPLYLQMTLGLDAFSTGVRMLPVSITLLVTSAAGAQLMLRFSPRRIVRIALFVLLIAIFVLLGTIKPTLDGFSFGLAMALLGFGIGLMAAVLGNLVQSAVGERDRSEAGALGNTAVQLGTALGTAVIGAIIISGLASSFISQVANDDRLSPKIEEAVEIELAGGVTFVTVDVVQGIMEQSDAEPEIATAIVENYAESQLQALKTALLATAVIVLISLVLTRKLPTKLLSELTEEESTEVVEPDESA
jgi:EmrB/QacA subfamily drug resistance transporter